MHNLPDLSPVIDDLRERRLAANAGATVVSVSGIDASGKGYVAAQLLAGLRAAGLRTMLLGIDEWLTPLNRRIQSDDPAHSFYRHAIRFDELFDGLIEPLRRGGGADLRATLWGPHGVPVVREFHPRRIEVVLVEGIFLLRRDLLARVDRRIWIDCSWRTALERALRRNQECLPPASIAHDYRTIYFPAQVHHFRLDEPRAHADTLLVNDPRLRHTQCAPADSTSPLPWA
ncbi:MAG: uridine kinase [Phycisphaerae bacterium]|nr:uridine kinase [Phycisphaerae bacterium]